MNKKLDNNVINQSRFNTPNFTIETQNSGDFEVQIFDLLRREVTFEQSKTSSNFQIPITNWTMGSNSNAFILSNLNKTG